MSQRYRVEMAIYGCHRQAYPLHLLALCRTGVLSLPDAAARSGMVAEPTGVRACMSGKRLGARRFIGYTRKRATSVSGGSSLVLCVLLWLGGTRFISWQITTVLLPSVMWHLCTLVALAFLLGTISTAWLSQRRLWSPAGERVTLARALVGITTAGFFVVWVLPAWAGPWAHLCDATPGIRRAVCQPCSST